MPRLLLAAGPLRLWAATPMNEHSECCHCGCMPCAGEAETLCRREKQEVKAGPEQAKEKPPVPPNGYCNRCLAADRSSSQGASNKAKRPHSWRGGDGQTGWHSALCWVKWPVPVSQENWDLQRTPHRAHAHPGTVLPCHCTRKPHLKGHVVLGPTAAAMLGGAKWAPHKLNLVAVQRQVPDCIWACMSRGEAQYVSPPSRAPFDMSEVWFDQGGAGPQTLALLPHCRH